jgi:N-6 DNA Methylase
VSTAYPSLHVEGGLLASELIDEIASGRGPGQDPKDFRLPERTRLLDVISSAWGDARDQWAIFQRGLKKATPSDICTTVTRQTWMTPLLSVLEYDLSTPGRSIEVNGLSFPISHRAGSDETAPPVHIVGARQCLDTRSESGRPRFSPHSLLQDYLNHTEHVWGFVTNGFKLRLLRDSNLLKRQAYIEFDLETMFEREHFADFALFYRLLHRSRLPLKDESANNCPLEDWFANTKERGGRVRDKLRDGLEQAMQLIANGLLRHPANRELRESTNNGDLKPETLYGQLLRLVYRLLFLMVTEERRLLCENAVYREHYSITRLRRLCEKRQARNEHTDLWQGLHSTFNLFHSESWGAILGVPPLNGDLFDLSRAENLEGNRLANVDLLNAFEHLSRYRERPNHPARPINYAALNVEELGSVYESLLDLHPVFEPADDGSLHFKFIGGTDRKTTGSYYTPPELVDELIKSALEPVIQDRLEGATNSQERAKRLLEITVCDPACGSGHFLLAAARRLARELALVRSTDKEPSPKDYRVALREVITHCIHGVDKNELAVELCKVALWLESHVEGKPLSFLDHRILCGDSLVGVRDLKLLREGVPDDAFKPLTGDDKDVSKEIKRRNKEARNGQRRLNFSVRDQLAVLSVAHKQLNTQADDTPAIVRKKKQMLEEARKKGLREMEAADLWTAAFFANLSEDDLKQGRIPDSEAVLKRIEGHTAIPSRAAAFEQASRLRFFHWPLNFPEVFERGGFDVVLGNPPWERIKLQQEEFFSTRNPAIANAANASARNALIKKLQAKDSNLWNSYQLAIHDAESRGKFLRSSSQYPLTSRGDINTYSVFAELITSLVRPGGRTGAVLPTGIATDDTNKAFFGEMATSGRLSSLFDFENRVGLFAAVDSRMKFSLLTLRGKSNSSDEPAEFAFFLTKGDQLRDEKRRFSLTPADFARLNPNTKTCPIFRTRVDAELTRGIYERIPVLINEATGENSWNMSFLRMFDMSNDSSLFRTREQLESKGFKLFGNRFLKGDQVYLPLYESKMMHQFDHRFGSFEEIDSRANSNLPTPSEVAHADAAFVAQPWYWVEQDEVTKALPGWNRRWLIGFRNVARATDERTAIFSVIPESAVGNSMPVVTAGTTAPLIGALIGNLSSISFDYVARQKVAGINMNFFYVQQFPVLPPSVYDAADLLFIVPRIVELTATAWDVQAFADDVWRESDSELRAAIEHRWLENQQITTGHSKKYPEWYTPVKDGFPHPPFRWCDERRAQLRAELDAYYARLYGLTERDLRYVLDASDIHGPDFPGETFRVLKKNETERYGEYRTQRLVLEAWRKLENRTTPAARSIEERMQEAAEQAHALVPTEDTWGFYGYGDASADVGGGAGGFLWFHTREEMLDFIRLYLPFWNGGPVHNDVVRVSARVGKIMERLNGAPLGEAFKSQLNQTLKGYTQIGWWGRFGELLSREGAFAREIRSWFRSVASERTGTGPIPGSEKLRFAKLLQDYGL